jgi:hypothetical protein
MPDISTLVEDIYRVLDDATDHTPNEAFLEAAAEQFKDALRRRCARQERRGSIRFSSLGKPDCQVWFNVNRPEAAEPKTPQTQMKFLYGDLLEILLLYLAKEAGHEVSHEQAEVECDGVLGHIDAVIDGHVVDVKSASAYAFRKFAENRVHEDDPFGYIKQLSGYCHQMEMPGAFLAINKESGGVVLSPLSPEMIYENPPGPAIQSQRESVALDNVRRCFDPVPDGKSGNEKLDTVCSYCDYKKACWPGLRGFLYSGKPRYLTTVKREPDVYEFNV